MTKFAWLLDRIESELNGLRERIFPYFLFYEQSVQSRTVEFVSAALLRRSWEANGRTDEKVNEKGQKMEGV